MSNFKIIIARYNEDLNWLEESPFNEFQYIVYNKGFNDNFNKTNVVSIINLPNLGKCDHTYLYHIANNYDNLDNILVFFPGSLNIQNKKSKAIEILNRIKNNNYETAIFLGNYSKNIQEEFNNFVMDIYYTSSSENRENADFSKTEEANIRPYGSWYLHNFGNIGVNFYTYQSIISVHKNDVLQHPINRYEKLIKQLEVGSNPEVGHYIERSWGAIFYPMTNTKILLHRNPVTVRKYVYIPTRKPRYIGRYNYQINKRVLLKKYMENKNKRGIIFFKNR